MPRDRLHRYPRRPFNRAELGATLVEFVVVAPLLLFVIMALIQYGLFFHAKSQVNYATYEAARAGSVANADPAVIRTAFLRAMTGYYGGGTTTSRLAKSHGEAVIDSPYVRIEILSPTKESFDDYSSPGLASRLGVSTRAIPNTNIAFIKCPIDVPRCAKDPRTNASGQTLLDANLLKIRVTYGIPPRKQLPLVGLFLTKLLTTWYAHDPDAFRLGLLSQERLPIVTSTVIRMQSPVFEKGNASIPGPGNGGTPTDPGPQPGPGPGPGDNEPKCPITNPACAPPPPCNASADPSGCRPPACEVGDPQCDPGCGKDYCCLLREGKINPGGPAPAASSTPIPTASNFELLR